MNAHLHNPKIRRAALLASTSLIAALVASGARAQTVLPTHGTVASGAATLSQSGSTLTVNQTSPRAVIDWRSFSIGAGAGVTFAQPGAGAATLNRVTGSTPSTIAGSLSANGQVFLVNPNGVAITRGGTVNVGGGFVASTLNISDNNFNNANLTFSGGGASAPVSNAGTITAAPGGFISLLGGSVSNSGSISAPLGKVGLGSGEQAALDLTGDGFLQVALPTNAQTSDGKALVDVSGKVKAAGGVVAIKAATAANAVRNAINLSGYASARSARAVGGSIVLDGGAGGDVRVSGGLDASGRTGGGLVSVAGRNTSLAGAKLAARSLAGKGGAVGVTAVDSVKLVKARIDVSGASGGGVVAVGGSARGMGPLADAARTRVDKDSVLRADALSNGDGGSITVWSNGATIAAGLLTARGGALGGDGGSVETSGATLDVAGARVITTAAHGKTGGWLLDPVDFTIAPGGDISGAMLSTELATMTTVTIQSKQGKSGTKGNINVDDTVSWSSPNTLTLDAFANIIVNQNITVQGSGVVNFIVGDAAQKGTGSTTGSVQFGLNGSGPTANLSFTGAGGTLTENGVNYVLLRSEGALALLNGTLGGAFALASNITLAQAYTTAVIPEFYGKLDGLGHTISNLSLTPAAATTNVGFIGVLDAAGSGTAAVPPAGSLGTVSNLFLANAIVASGASNNVGIIAGESFGLVSSSGSSGTITGTGASLGGLVGANTGLVLGSLSSAVVTLPTGAAAGTGQNFGGLVGLNSGGISGGQAFGDVTGGQNVGGVAGQNTGFVNSGSSGFIVGDSAVGGVVGLNVAGQGNFTFQTVTYGPNGAVQGGFGFGGVFGTAQAGGVVGLNQGTVSASYFNGPVSGDTSTGGVVGENDGALSNDYAVGPISGITNVGGLAGFNRGSIDSSFALGAVRGTTDVGGLVGLEGATAATTSVSNSFSTGAVTGTTGVDGLIGALAATTDDTITNAFWDTLTSGHLGRVGSLGVGETTTQLQGGATLLLGANFTGGAAGGTAGVYPYLIGLFPNGARAISGFAYQNPTGQVPLASGANGAVTVTVDANPSSGAGGIATTGANGYYYVLSSKGDPLAGADIVAYTTANATTGATNAATYQVAGAANNTTLVNIAGSTLTETTASPTYSQLAAAVSNTIAGDTAAGAAVAGVSFINITATGAGFTVDQPISTTAGLTISSATTALDANVAATRGVTFNSPVTLGATVTVNSGAAATTFAGAVDGSATAGAGLTVSGPVTLDGNVTTANAALNFGRPVTINANVTINSGTATTAFGSTVDSGLTSAAHFSLTAAAGAFTFGGALGGNFALGAVSLTSTAAMTLPSVAATSILAQTTGAAANLTLSAALTASGLGTPVTLATAGAFINDAGANAIDLTGLATQAPNWLVYSNNPTADVFGGLNSNNRAIWGATFPATAGPTSGDFYLFAFTPTVTFTSINDAKTYGQDATAKVATDFTVSGLQAGVAGAFLPDTAAVVFSGAPSVTSVGSPTAATVASGPYAITVAQGTLASIDKYLLAFASPGVLTVNPEAITVTAAANAKTYDSTTAAATAPTVTTGTLFDAATLAETYAAPNAGTGLRLTPTLTFTTPASASNYIVTLTSANTGVINPEPITVTAAANAKTYDSTTAAANTPTVTTGTLFDAATLAETYAAPNAGTGLRLTPTLTFTTPASASNYIVTLTSANTGVINPEPITVTAAANAKTYDSTTAAANTPTVTTGTLFDAATLAETYAAPNAGIGLRLDPTLTFTTPASASNYIVTLTSANTGVINPEPITVTAAANAKTYDSTTAAANTPTVTAGTLFDAATLAETYAAPNAGTGLQLNPTLTFATPAAASNYAVTLAPANTGVINPEPITVTAAANAKTYDSKTTAANAPTVTAGTLFDAATLAETYAAPNAGTGLQLNPALTFTAPASASNYAVTLAPANTGVINPEAITVTATPATKPFDGTTATGALPTLTTGTLFDPATLSETFATPGPGADISLNPAIAFGNPGAANNYAVTLVPTGTVPPNTGVILAPPIVFPVNTSPSVFVDRNFGFGIPDFGETCGAELQLPQASAFSDPVAALQAVTAATTQYVERCRDASQADIADALDRYADALQIIIEKLPPKLRQQLRHIPTLVHAAATRARAAPTRAAAVRVLKQVVVQVRQEIALVRADDPDSARLRNAVSASVTGVLNTAAVTLARAEGI